MNSVKELFHEWRFNIKIVALLLPLIYFCILQNHSEEYTSKHEYCISETHSCTTPNSEYGIEENTGFLPFCRDETDNNLCVRSYASSCLYQHKHRYENIVIEDEIVLVQHNYFEYAIPIIVLTVLSCVGTLFFQSKLLGISFIRDESAFSSVQSTEICIDKFISACIALVFSLMIVSNLHFRYMRHEECDFNSHNNGFCNDLNMCGLEIRSIMIPTNWLTRDYHAFVIASSLIVLVVELYCFIFPPQHEENVLLEDGGRRIRQMTIRSSSTSLAREDSDNHGNSFVYVVQTPRGSLVNRRYMAPARAASSPRASQSLSPARYVQQHQAFKHSHRHVFRKWNFHVAMNTLGEDDECAICLETFRTNTSKNDNKKESETCPRDRLTSTLKWSAKGSAAVHPIDRELGEDSNNDDNGCITLQPISSVKRQESLLDLQSIVRIPCGHVFHEMCIFEWIRENETCPVCRANTATGHTSDTV